MTIYRRTFAAPVALATLALTGVFASRAPAADPEPIRWKKTVLDTKFRSEGVAVADVNKDGKPDVLVGDLWYEAPAWTPHPIRALGEYTAATGYSNAFMVFAADIDRDGWTDQIVVGFPGAPAKWYRNPGEALKTDPNAAWAEQTITESACNESALFGDVDGDGKPELLSPFKESQMAYYKPDAKLTSGPGFTQHLIGEAGKPGTQRFSHGLGVGDVNGDGRADILCNEGYYEAPKGNSKKRGETVWNFVPAKLGDACAHMYTHDFDNDGDLDVISSSAHNIGVWWYEQTPGENGPEFTRHVIDNRFSQSHSLMMADLNADGNPDFVTGKRWWAHGPAGDVNANDPAVVYWYEFSRDKARGVQWVRHEIDADSGVGTQFTIADVNRDNRPDVITSNKKGVFILAQVP
jgi:hypothetical protein